MPNFRIHDSGNVKRAKRKAKEQSDKDLLKKMRKLTTMNGFNLSPAGHIASANEGSCDNVKSDITNANGGQNDTSEFKSKKVKTCTAEKSTSVESCLDTRDKAPLQLNYSAKKTINSPESEISEINVVESSDDIKNKNIYSECNNLNIDRCNISEPEYVIEHENLQISAKSGMLQSDESGFDYFSDIDEDGLSSDYIEQNLKNVFESESENEPDEEYSSSDNKDISKPYIDNDLDNGCIDTNFDHQLYSSDLGDWPYPYPDRHRDFWIAKGSSDCQHSDSDFIASKRYNHGDNCYRFCKKEWFMQIHNKTKQRAARNWLCYSESKGTLFCFICKLMVPSNYSTTFTETGFDDWKHACDQLKRHEETKAHKQACFSLLARKKSGARVDSKLVKQMEEEEKHWRKVLTRIIEVIKHLAERNQAFRGDNEIIGSPHNGNYLGTLELLSKFDPFLEEHIQQFGNKGKGKVSYLSKTTCEEFINLIGKRLLETIIYEVKKCKYYSISLDSTPDISKVDQLTLIIRYVLPTGPVERFLIFLGMESHTGAELCQSLLDFLKKHDIDIKDCRGQSYDNASNMSGKYIGLQAKVKELNEYAEYIPCFAHSLNLVGQCAADCCSEVTQFFAFVESVYTFFSASTGRWSLLHKALVDAGLRVVKKLCSTRWSARADAVEALKKGYLVIGNVLQKFSNNKDQKAECRQQARGLYEQMKILETGIMVILWSKLLERFQKTSVALQSSTLDLNKACGLLDSLSGYVIAQREQFSTIEEEAKLLTKCTEYQQAKGKRKVKRNKKYDDFVGSNVPDENFESLSESSKFKTQVFLVIIDKLITTLAQRKGAYEKVCGVFGQIRNLKSLTNDQIKAMSSNLIKAYPKDLDDCLSEEFVQFNELLKSDIASHIGQKKDISIELQFYNLITDNDLQCMFVNVEIVLRIYLSLMVTNCTGERSFSKLNIIKDRLRNSMGQERLNNLTIMSIEYELLRNMETTSIINEFAYDKSRKKT